MSQPFKTSVWQKIKQLLRKSATNDAEKTAESDRSELPPSSNPSENHSNPPLKAPSTEAPKQEALKPDALKKDTLKQDALEKDDLAMFDSLPELSATPITEFIKDYFEQKQWHYSYFAPQDSDSQQSHHLSLRMKNKDIDCGYLFRVQESGSLLAVYGILPFLIPESHQSAAMLLITQINYDMIIGNLEMDVNDGEVRYKNAIDVEALGLDEEILESLLQSVVAMTTVAFEIFSDLINTPNPSTDLPTLLDELRSEAQSRTFFLPTELVQ